MTTPRLKILALLETSRMHHFTTEEIYQALVQEREEIGLATVYRVLTQFEAAGLVNRHHFEGGRSIFEFNSGEHHDHLVCVQCGKIEEFVNEAIEAQQAVIAQQAGFHMTDHELNIYGVCKDCK